MKHKGKTFLTDEKIGIIDRNEDGDLTLYVELGERIVEYNIEELLEKWIGGELSLKYVSDSSLE